MDLVLCQRYRWEFGMGNL